MPMGQITYGAMLLMMLAVWHTIQENTIGFMLVFASGTLAFFLHVVYDTLEGKKISTKMWNGAAFVTWALAALSLTLV